MLLYGGIALLANEILNLPPNKDYGRYQEIKETSLELLWKALQIKLRDDEIETLRKEYGYLQEGARYDPIPGKQAQEPLPEELRDPSYWVTFQPTK